jgi:antitoxin component HigA of HigAB toxin-antitoxin module
LLESIQKSLGFHPGDGIYKHGIDSLDYRVSSLKNIRVVINHFDRYPLITKKLADYILFKQAVDMVQQKQHLTIEGILKLVSIKASLF